MVNKKIPSFLGIIVIIIGIIATIFLVRNERIIQINAGPGQEPKNIEVSNVSDSSFTITYTTDDSVIGTLNIGETSNNLSIKNLDIRDKNSQSVSKYQTHHLVANNLKPNKTYYYTITSGDKTFSNNGSSYELKTAPSIGKNLSNKTVASGKVINPDGTIPTGAIVVVKINGAQPISSILNSDGSYSIPMSNLRTFGLDKFADVNEELPVNIDIFAGNLKSQVNLSSNQLSNIPLVTLSNNYHFSEVNSVVVKNNRENVTFPEFSSKANTQKQIRSLPPTKSPSTSPNL